MQSSVLFIALAFDAFIFALTLKKTFHHAMEMKRLGELSIAQVILRDGMTINFNIIDPQVNKQFQAPFTFCV